MLHHVQCWVEMCLRAEGEKLLKPTVGEGRRVGMVVGGGRRQWCLGVILIQWQGLQRRGRDAWRWWFYSSLPASVDTMSPFHVLVVVWPVGKMVLTLQTGIRSFTCMLPSMSLKKNMRFFLFNDSISTCNTKIPNYFNI